MNKIAEYTYFQLYIISLILILLISSDVIWKYSFHLEILAIITGVIGALALKRTKDKPLCLSYKKVIVIFLIIFSIGLFFRLIPYFSNTIPLGYDPGIYKYVFEKYFSYLPNISLAELPEWIISMHEPGLFVFMNLMHLMNLSMDKMLTCFFSLLCSLVALPIYLVGKRYFNRDIGIIASFFYLFSIIQFQTFWFMYYKNVIGIFFLLIGLYFMKENRMAPLLLTSIFIGFLHRPTFLLFALIFFIYTLMNFKDRKMLIRNIGILMITCLALMPMYYNVIIGNMELLESAITEPAPGSFINPTQFQFISLVYLPFSIIGLYYLINKKDFKNPLLIWFIINFSIVAFQLIFYNRFLIFFDVILILLASVGFYYSIIRGDLNKWLRIGIILLIVIASLWSSYNYASDVVTLITDKQMNAIEWMNNTENNSFLLATSSYYSPWVLGYSGRNVIVPGIFEYDQWDKEQWQEFWSTDNATYVKEILSVYPRPLYIHISTDKIGINTDKFNDSCFEEALNDNETIIYRYRC